MEADVTDPDALKAAVQRTVDTFGGLDVVVANAGIAPLTTVMTSSAHALARTIEVNLIGAMLTAHAALPEIAKRKGHVLLISSAAAFTVLPGMSAYCASKAGVERFGDALRLEVAHRGVTVASAHPTWIDTDMVRDTEAALPTFKADRSQLPGPLGAYTSVEACAEALVENLETRGRRVFVPRSVGTVSALRQVVTGAVAEKLAMRASATRVPQLEQDIAALDGREFGTTPWAAAPRAPPDLCLSADEQRSAAVAGHQAVLVGVHDGLHAVAEAELGQHAGDVRLHGRPADEQLGGDLVVGQPAGHQPEDLELPGGQALVRSVVPGGRGTAGEFLDHPPGDGRREQCLSAGDEPDAPHELLRRGVLEQEAARAGPQRAEDVVVEVERGQHEGAAVGAPGRRSGGPPRSRPPAACGRP